MSKYEEKKLAVRRPWDMTDEGITMSVSHACMWHNFEIMLLSFICLTRFKKLSSF